MQTKKTTNLFDLLRARRSGGSETGSTNLGESAPQASTPSPKTAALLPGKEEAIPWIDLQREPPKEEVLTALPEWIVKNFTVLPHHRTEAGELVVVTANPYDILAEQEIRRVVPKVLFARAEAEQIQYHIERAMNALSRQVKATQELRVLTGNRGGTASAVQETDRDSALVELVDGILREAILRRASDVHIEPLMRGVRVRFRIDGELREQSVLESMLLDPIVARLKVMAGLDTTERRLPLDGRITFQYNEHRYRLRLSTIPGVHGEGVVIRILPDAGHIPRLEELGFLEDTLALFRALIRKPYGILLITGPTGSGKTTTLFSSVQEIYHPSVKIVTVEDPVEYELPGAFQIQVQPEIGRTFARVLRSILRHDPDVIVVGEIRDQETARIAMEASLTGHLVLATLHTNDATSAPIRLMEMGVEPYLMSNLLGVLAQRLVRKVCPHCKAPYQPALPEEVAAVRGRFVRGRGCDRCDHTGYYGRTAIHELLVMSENAHRLLLKHPDATELRALAMKEGMRTLLQDGVQKAARGWTTIEEVLSRVHI
jgi:type IV pilus assembly protein PilB